MIIASERDMKETQHERICWLPVQCHLGNNINKAYRQWRITFIILKREWIQYRVRDAHKRVLNERDYTGTT